MVEACLADSNFDPNEEASERSTIRGQRIMSTGFIEACYFGHTEIISSLLQDRRIDVNKGDTYGKTGFIYACYGRTEIVRLLLKDTRVDVNKGDTNGITGFIHACADGARRIVTSLLEDSHTDVNKGDSDGVTGFIYACSSGCRDIVSLLLEDSRIDVNKEDNDGETGFMYACESGHKEIVTLLLQDSRIVVSKPAISGYTGFIYACQNGHTETVSLLSESERVDCVCGWKESADRLCRRVSENATIDEDEEESLHSVWDDLNRIGVGVFMRGWEGEDERMKEVWIYGGRRRRKKNKRSSETVSKRETKWRRVTDYILEEDITSVLILCHHAEIIRRQLTSYSFSDRKSRVLEMETL